MRILFVSAWYPSPPINGAKIRINNLLRYLAEEHEVTLISFVNTLSCEEVERQTPMLLQFCKRVTAVRRPPINPARSRLGYLSPLPRHLAASMSGQFRQAIQDEIKREQFDIVVASEVGPGSQVSLAVSKLRGYPRILDALEIGSFADGIRPSQPRVKRYRNYLTWLKMRAYLSRLMQNFDVCTVPSRIELQYVTELLGPTRTRLEVVPHSLDLARLALNSTMQPEPNSLVYNGSLTYFPNKDAVGYFLTEILPRIKQAVPGVKLRILGNPGDFGVAQWQSEPGVEFCGLVRDVRPAIWQSWATVVPLRQGSGTRLKIIEAMALGTPVISSSKGAEGLDVTPGENILIADNAEEFAAQTISLLRSTALRQKLAEAGRKLVESRYDWRVIGSQFNRLVSSASNLSDERNITPR